MASVKSQESKEDSIKNPNPKKEFDNASIPIDRRIFIKK